MIRWKLAALSGWATSALWFVTAYRAVRSGREQRDGHVEEAGDHGYHEPPPRSRPIPILTRRPRLWGQHLAREAEALVALGFEDQAVHLFTASGELLDRDAA